MSRRWGPRRKSPDAAERGFIEPCLATLKPDPPAGGDWIHEIKFDGYRMMARQGRDGPMLFTRMGFDWTERFGDRIADALDALPATGAYLDGEVVVEDGSGRSNFADLQDDLQRGRTDRLVYYAFDLLQLNGEDLRARPLLERKAALAELLARQAPDGPIRYSAHFEDPDGKRMLEQSCRLGLEGIISKRGDRPYRSGRGLDWIKSRCTQQETFVIAGYEPAKGSSRQVAALLIGKRAGRGLRYMGHVGTGFSRASAGELWKRLSATRISRNPFSDIGADELAGAVFVEPRHLAEIDFRGWTGEGRVRHASYRGLVETKAKATGPRSRAAAAPSKLPRVATTLCKAIAGRRKVELRYDSTDAHGHPEKWRVFHPHALYAEADGTLSVTGRQEVRRRREPLPRNFKLVRILAIRLLEATFAPGPPVKAASPKYRHGIVCRVGSGGPGPNRAPGAPNRTQRVPESP